MKTIFTSVFLLFAFITQAQTQNSWFELSTINNDPDYPFTPEKNIEGICFIIPSQGFDLYKKPLIIRDRDIEILRIQFSESEGLATIYQGKLYHTADSMNEFRPWLFNDYANTFTLALECTDTAGAFYKVRLNHTDVAFISKRNKDFQKISFEHFIAKWTRNGFDFDRTKSPLRSSPSPDAPVTSHPEETKYTIWPAQAREVKGDWMNITTIKGEQGWIRWKNGDQVLIRIYFQFQ
jgi:hypothetical protein